MPRASRDTRSRKPRVQDRPDVQTKFHDSDSPPKAAEQAAGRDARGKFAKGNVGGPGNPYARESARMLKLFRSAISDEEMRALILKLRD